VRCIKNASKNWWVSKICIKMLFSHFCEFRNYKHFLYFRFRGMRMICTPTTMLCLRIIAIVTVCTRRHSNRNCLHKLSSFFFFSSSLMGDDYPCLPASSPTVRLDHHSCVSGDPRRRLLYYYYH
jgi:hypothetical protein